jgi:hypothetical protein
MKRRIFFPVLALLPVGCAHVMNDPYIGTSATGFRNASTGAVWVRTQQEQSPWHSTELEVGPGSSVLLVLSSIGTPPPARVRVIAKSNANDEGQFVASGSPFRNHQEAIDRAIWYELGNCETGVVVRREVGDGVAKGNLIGR